MRRTLALAVLAGTAALATPAAAGPRVCTPSVDGTTVGGCADVVCLRLCVLQVDVDPQCSINHPTPMPVSAACSHVDRQYVSVGPG